MSSPSVCLPLTCDAGQRLVGVELRGERGGDGLEVRVVSGCPPVANGALGVEVRAFAVEGVGDLVADDGADGAVVGGVGRRGIEERRLQDGGGEVEAVVERKVDGVDGLRIHAPLLAIDGLADAAELVVILEELGAPDVAEEIVGTNLEAGVGAEGVGIADADLQRAEFGECFGLGGGRHPCDRFEALVIDGEKVGDEALGLRAGLGREEARGVELADGLAEVVVEEADGADVARALLLRSAELGAEEGEPCIVEGFRHVLRVVVDERAV